jgi:adenylate cyclase
VPYNHIRDALLGSRAARRVVILDCCYSGLALGTMADPVTAAVDEASAEGTYILAATAENKQALAPPDEPHTAFTAELLGILHRGILGGGALLDLDTIYHRVRAAMRDKGRPLPQKRDRNTAGQLTLIHNLAYQRADESAGQALAERPPAAKKGSPDVDRITVLLADDNLIVREGVHALLSRDDALQVVGVAADYDELVDAALRLRPQVLVTDIRMPPTFQDEGIEAARQVRGRLPGTGVVVLSQYDDPEYAVKLLAGGPAGYGYLLKDKVGDSTLLGRAIREVAAGGSMIDPQIVQELLSPARDEGELTDAEEDLLRQVAEGRPVKVIAAARDDSPEVVDAAIDKLFLDLARDASAGRDGALRRLRLLHTAITRREEQGETLSRLLPSGLADKLLADRGAVERTERLVVTVLMSDVRGYAGIAEHTDPAVLAGQLNAHRRAMNGAILAEGGTVMQYVGDAVMAVFGAPDRQPDHAVRAVRAARGMHAAQHDLDADWAAGGLAGFGLGIGLCTGEVAAALLGSDEWVEYTLVGDTVNLAQRMQDLARPAGTTVATESTVAAVGDDGPWTPLGPRTVKGRTAPVVAYLLTSSPHATLTTSS